MEGKYLLYDTVVFGSQQSFISKTPSLLPQRVNVGGGEVCVCEVCQSLT